MVTVELDHPIVTVCHVCGWTAMPGTDLCVGCLDIREWSRVNRAFCDFLHRGHEPDFVSASDAPFSLSAGLA